MKKLYLALMISIMAINIAAAQTGWITYKIDERLSAKIPAQAQIIGKGSIKSVSKDSVVCIISKIDFLSTVQMDSIILAPLLPTQEFANELRSGMRGQMEGFTLGNVKIDRYKGYYSYSLEGTNPTKKSRLYTYMLIVGNNLYAFSTLVPENKSLKVKDIFFSSLILN